MADRILPPSPPASSSRPGPQKMPSTAGKKPGLYSVAEAEQGRRSGAYPLPDPDMAVYAKVENVKVYRVTADGQWDDQGTGHVTIDYIEGSSKIALAVKDEEDDGTLLVHNISLDDIYRKEEETIISLKDSKRALDLVLSFQDAEGCSNIWQHMLSIQKNLQSSAIGSQVLPYSTFETPESSSSSHGLTVDDSLVSVNDELKDLPPLELSSLPSILKTVLEWGMKDQTHVAELISQDDEFFPKLVDLFRMCEGSKNMDGLHMIFRLVKGIILLNNHEMFNNIFSDDFILDIIGALEYDPEVCHVHNHRASVQKQVLFKEAIPIKNAFVASKINQTKRIGYIKDVILPKALDDATVASLNSIIHGNNVLVVCLLRDDASFIQDLFAKMKSSNTSAESKSKLVLYLHKFLTLSRSLQPIQQLQLSRDLAREGLFGIISDALQSQDEALVSAGTNILQHFLDQDPNFLRKSIAHHEENYQGGNSFLGVLVQGMVIGSGEEMCCRCLMTLLDSSAPKTATNCEVVIQVFFDKHLHELIDVIASSCPPKGIAGSTSGSVGVDTMVEQHSAKTEILLNICELLCFCVRHHCHRMKVNFSASNAMEKILTLTCQREKALVLAAVRFMRTIIGRKDEFLNNHVIKLNLLKPIIEAFVENGDRYNMLHSAVLELLDYIRKENLDFLIEYVAESFWDQLVKFERLESIQAYKLNYQQIMESAKTKQSAIPVAMRKRKDERGADKNEDYFKDSGREDCATAETGAQKQSMPVRPKPGGHADCDDDDYDPPPRKPIKADEDDEALVKPRVRSSPDDGSHTSGKACKKPKLRFIFSFAKSVASANNLEDEEVPLSASRTTASSEDSDDLGDGSSGSQHQQHAPEILDPVHQKGEDGNDAAEGSSPKMDPDTAKSTDSEPN